MKNITSKLILAGIGMISILGLAACGGDSASVDSSGSKTVNVSNKETTGNIAPAKMGANGQYDEHALAKKVKKAIDNISNLSDSTRVYVAQKGNIVYLKGTVSERRTLEKIVSVVRNVQGVESVNTDGINLK